MMRHLFQNFGRAHLYIFLGFYIAFAALTFLVLNWGTASDRRENAIAAAVAGTVTGPFTGAIARHFQPCCLRFSLSILPWCVLFLGTGILFQMIPLPFPRWSRAVRLALWCAGLLGWFGGGLVSFIHALS